MPRYSYKAIRKGGFSYQGTYVAGSKEDVIKMLRNNQSYTVSIEEEDLSSGVSLFKPKKLKAKELSVFCRQLYAMLNAGIPIVQSLEILRKQTEKISFKNTLDAVYEEVQKGMVFSEALRRHRHMFPEIMVHMVEAGELGGSLDSAALRLANHFEREAELKSKLQNALVYPIILTFATIAVVFFLLTFVMPTFVGMFETAGVQLPLPTRIVMGFSDALRQYWYVFIGAIAGLILVIIQYMASAQGGRFIDGAMFKIPGVKKVMTLVMSSRFTRTLSTLLSSGIPLIQALESIEHVIGNKVLSDDLAQVRREVQSGGSFSGAVSRVKVFPPMVSSMINIGEQSGAMDSMLSKTADFYDKEADNALTRLVAIFEPVMIIIMGVSVGFIVIAMILPLFDLTETIM